MNQDQADPEHEARQRNLRQQNEIVIREIQQLNNPFSKQNVRDRNDTGKMFQNVMAINCLNAIALKIREEKQKIQNLQLQKTCLQKVRQPKLMKSELFLKEIVKL